MRNIKLILISIIFSTNVIGYGKSWPSVPKLKQTFKLQDSGSKSVVFRIDDNNGCAAYLFEAYLNAYEWDSPPADFILSGDFECELTPLYGRRTYENLLTYARNQTRSIQNRGRFMLDEFANKSTPAPMGWGLDRKFSFRGIDFEIKIISFACYSENDQLPSWAEKGKKRLKWIKFEIDMQANPKAENSIQPYKEYIAPN